MTHNWEEMDVQGTFSDGSEECIGMVELPEDAEGDGMPTQVEINGYTYIREDRVNTQIDDALSVGGN